MCWLYPLQDKYGLWNYVARVAFLSPALTSLRDVSISIALDIYEHFLGQLLAKCPTWATIEGFEHIENFLPIKIYIRFQVFLVSKKMTFAMISQTWQHSSVVHSQNRSLFLRCWKVVSRWLGVKWDLVKNVEQKL